MPEPGSFRFEVIEGTSDVGLFYTKKGTNIGTQSSTEDIATIALDVFIAK
jgi:hypothetical protein